MVDASIVDIEMHGDGVFPGTVSLPSHRGDLSCHVLVSARSSRSHPDY
jgi:hypothetical protein